ncbi:acylneuraminate cytidylyltransferase family protein [Solirubrobacter ginsenosidimutans]|uniref:Acylneuraminate cytidylyltransferase family protein n=1 Tax=Solirubrobacter ginsenosidimutans TaxID=490573 RepID=A0A9X3S2L2_9ACTN|nr:acylneuraminate cytidylyltransferase family protein [Solirubrobacter ginsenosidimutans]MDA0164745.1 acylneuraminate cytidylyltransferase family protein [Solirubrobacter ginsenosidimutans]
MATLGLIPARGGSKRAPGKNLAVLGGRTLVRRAVDCGLASGALDCLVLSSDDPAILDEGEGIDGLELLARPAELATDSALAVDVARHALDAMEAQGRGPFSALALIQCTSPFTAPEDIAATVKLVTHDGGRSAVSVTQADQSVHPLRLKRIEAGRILPFLEDDAMAPAHALPELWIRNGSIYVCSREVLFGGSLVDPDDTRAHPMPAERSLDVNTPLDLAFAEFLIDRGAAV